jgi:ACS family hexuronate transporter-like MFS transporter
MSRFETISNPASGSPSGNLLGEQGRRLRIRGLRWWIVVLVFVAAVLNYVDRQTLGTLAPTIQRDLGMDDRHYADVLNIFLIAYTVSYLVAGKLADKLGTRAGLCLFVLWWSLADMLTAAARGIRSLGAYRFLIGLAEAGVWPAASKAVSEWFPPRERALAIGIYTMGATVGATLTPYLVIPLAAFPFQEKLPFLHQLLGQGTGWRVAFILNGCIGLMWVLPWLALYRLPRQSKYLREEELRLIEEPAAGESQPSGLAAEQPWTWRQVFACRAVWLLLLARLITDPAWYFYQFWFSKYLNTERHLAQDQLKITWIVYAAAGVGSLLGGWLSGRLIKRGLAPANSRLWVMLGCACLLPFSPLISSVSGLGAAMAVTVIVVLAALAWLINLSAIIVDVVPKHSLGTVFSVVAAGSTMGGILMNLIVATMVCGPSAKPAGFLDQALRTLFGGILEAVQGKGYAQWFLLMAFLHPVAWLILRLGGVQRPLRPNS